MSLTLSVVYQDLTPSCKYLLTCRCNLFKIFSGYLNFSNSLLDMKSEKLICQRFILAFFAMGDCILTLFCVFEYDSRRDLHHNKSYIQVVSRVAFTA